MRTARGLKIIRQFLESFALVSVHLRLGRRAQASPKVQTTIISWNSRGLAVSTTSRELQDLMKTQKMAILFLMETRAQKKRVERVRRKLKFSNMFYVPAIGIAGGLALLWNKSYCVQVLNSCINYVHTAIQEKKTGNTFEITFVYANPTFDRRRYLWGKLQYLMPRRQGPWCCIGDFNEMCSVTEKDGLSPVAPIRMSLFRDFLNSTDLMDLDLKGNKYIWASNPRDGVVTFQKIDRIPVNWGWRYLYPHAIGLALPIVNSDHSPLCYSLFPLLEVQSPLDLKVIGKSMKIVRIL